jgi:murein DD-endopeptidase MepM/ murein hydrolase activator NlpD
MTVRWLGPAILVAALGVPSMVSAQSDPTETTTTLAPDPVTTLPPTAPPTTPPTAAPVASTAVPPVVVPPNETTTTTVAPSSTIPGETSTSTSTSTVPESTTTTKPIDLSAIGDFEEEVSVDDQPPPFKPVLPPSPLVLPRNIELEKALAKLTAQQRRIVDEAQKQADAATERIAVAQREFDALRIREDELNVEKVKLEQKKEAIAIKIRARALRIYAGESVADLDLLLRSADANEFARNVDIIGVAQRNDAALLEQFSDAGKKLEANRAELESLTAQKQAEIESLVVEQEVLTESLATLQEQLSFVLSGQAIALGGFVFPVGAPFNFASTFGAPRMTGTKYEHTHKGNDIFATEGTPLYATTRGVIARKAVAVLGGNKLWLVGADGTQYYYAHLLAYADGLQDGSIVEAGQVIGFVGDTGNAKGTPPHLHFEIHPGGGEAIDPYPILDAVRRSDAGRLATAARALAATTTTTPPPGSGNAGIGVSLELSIAPVDASAAGPPPTSTVVPTGKATTTKAA